ncbi:DUF4347 domain-containing protein [Anabaena minutissima FACHB-250]|nr:DUF4347 domain-containing protein [Anabaena minutissima FACHB-250]
MELNQAVSTKKNSHLLVFIDAGVKDYQKLKNSVQAEADVFILHPEADGVEQITDTIAQYSYINSIHIVSHGASGTLYLGDTELSLDTLKYYNSELQTWFNSVSQHLTPALFLYGCHVAKTDAGTEFVEKLHQLTQATIYASSTPVGNSALGGNWNLDIRCGEETPNSLDLVFQPEVLNTYSGVFAVPSMGSSTTNNIADYKYIYYDSRDLSGKGTVAYSSISSTGTLLTVANNQQNQVQLPFAFNFYGESFNFISIGENGALGFVSGLAQAGQFRSNNASIPSSATNVQQKSIFPFWDDLTGGQIHYKTDGDRFIIQWSNFAHQDLFDVDYTDGVTFQVILHKGSNNIDFVYPDTVFSNPESNEFDSGAQATIGLNQNGASGLKYSFDEASLNGVTSIRFITEPRLVTKTLTIKEGETITLSSSNFNATDVDTNNDPSKITYTISNPEKGVFKNKNTAATLTQFTQQDINNGIVQFVHDGGEVAPSLSISITDGFNPTNPIALNVANQAINFTNVNDNPELSNLLSTVTFQENALNTAAAIIDSSITLVDVDSPDFNGGNLTVTYTSGAGQEDQLSISSTNSIILNGSTVSFNGNVIGNVDSINNGSNGKSLVVNFTNTNATLAVVKALIENLSYQNTSHTPSASRTISVTVNDGDLGTSTAVTTVINVTAENDAPVNNIPGSQPISVDEDKPLAFTGSNLIAISDSDAGNNPVQVKLEATNGRLNLKSVDGLTFTPNSGGDGIDDAILEFQGTIANINKALDGMTFQPGEHYNGPASVKVTTYDLGNSGATVNNLNDTDTIDITVKAINDAPENTVPQQQSVKEDTNLTFSSANGNLIKIKDVDAAEGTGNAEVTLSVTKGILTLKQTDGLTFTANNNGSSTMTFTGQVGAINSALDGLIYRGNPNTNGAEILNIVTKDLGNSGEGGQLEDGDIINIIIDPVNDAPINIIPNAQSVREDTDLIFSTSNSNSISISDVDVNEGTGELEVTLSVTQGVLTLADSKGISFSSPSQSGSASMTFKGTLDDINKALNGLSYRGKKDFNGKDTLSISTSDLGNKGEPGALTDLNKTVEINVTPVNDAPENIFPQQQSVAEDQDLVFQSSKNNAIRISDVDTAESQDQLKVTLAVTKGKLTLGTTIGLSTVENNSTAAIAFTGTQANINQALEGLTYRGNQDFNGLDTLTITTQDLGNTGADGEQTTQNTIQLTVTTVNDAPINTVPGEQSVKEDTDLIFSVANKNFISVRDLDVNEGTGELEVTLSVTKGVLTLKQTTGLTFLKGSGITNAEMTFKGKEADINNALESLIYRGNLHANGEDTLTITTNDLKNTGTGDSLQKQDTVKITVTPVNDAPINTVPTIQSVTEDTVLVFNTTNNNAISISDVDIKEGTDVVEVTLSVNNGLLTLKQTAGLTFAPDHGNENATITFRGKVADINNALNDLAYLGTKDFVGIDTLTITTNDLGNFGSDGIQIAKNTIDINVSLDVDTDGINDRIEEQVINKIVELQSTDITFLNLSQQAVNNSAIVAFFGNDADKTRPTVIAISEEDQKQLGGSYQTPALVFSEVKILRFNDVVLDPIAVFDDKDTKKASLKKVTAALDIINFKIIPNPAQTDENLQQQIKDATKQKPIKIEIKLPDGPEDIAVNAILKRKTDGTLYDFRRELNTKWGDADDDLLTGAILQDRNLNGKADWAVVYLQDGEWGDEEDLSDIDIEKSLVAVNLDFGTSRMEVRSNQEGLNFHGNRSFVQFSLNRFSGVDASEVGIARVRFGNNGQIIEVDGKAVNSLDEAKQAIIQRGETLFSSLTNKLNPGFGSQNRTIAFEEGEQAVFFMIQGGTKDELLFNGINSNSVQFSLSSLNNGVGILTASTDERGQVSKLSLGGLFDIGARILSIEEVNFQSGLLAISQTRRSQGYMAGELIDLKSSGAFDNKQVMLKVSLYREASNNNSAYLYRTDDAKGSIRDPLTGMLIDPTTALSADQKQRYLQLATSDRLVKDVQFQGGNLITTEVSTVIKGGEYYAPFLVSDGTLSSIGNDFSRILTSYMGINSDRVDHIRNLGNNVFGIEDVVGGGDRDYNDMIFSIKQVQVMA